MFVGKPESEHSIQHGEHVRNQKNNRKKKDKSIIKDRNLLLG
jgi:hypothetical protein